MKPKCWANDLADWSLITNICHPQKNKLKVEIVKVLQESIRNRLVQKGITDPDKHVDKNSDASIALRKEKFRGMTKKKTQTETQANENATARM